MSLQGLGLTFTPRWLLSWVHEVGVTDRLRRSPGRVVLCILLLLCPVEAPAQKTGTSANSWFAKAVRDWFPKAQHFLPIDVLHEWGL